MKSRLVDRIYISFVIIVGSWALWRYYTFCFSDCISSITARSLIVTTTTTQYMFDDDRSGNGTSFSAGGGRGDSDGGDGSTVKSRTRFDARSPEDVKQFLRDKKHSKAAEKAGKKDSKYAAEVAIAEIQQGGNGVVYDGTIPRAGAGSGKTLPGMNDEQLAAMVPTPLRPRKKTSKKTVVRPLTMKDRFSPIVIRDLVWLLVSLLCTVMMVWSYYMAVTTDPGLVPKCFSIYAQKASRMALSTGGTLSKCPICQVFKPPRCHHCSKCGRCVLKYDHHCYWIGQCVGYFNYKVFLNFCFWTCVFANVATISLSRSVYLFFFQVVNSATPAKTVIHALTETTTVYIRDSPIIGSTEVTKVPITADVIVLFFVVFMTGWLSWYMVKKHYFLARDNKTTVEEMILDGDPSPYGLSTEHNWEEVFGDRDSPVKGALRWVWRLVPTLAYGKQKQSEIDSHEYFALLKEERRKQRVMQEYKNTAGVDAFGNGGGGAGGGYGATNTVDHSRLSTPADRNSNMMAAATPNSMHSSADILTTATSTPIAGSPPQHYYYGGGGAADDDDDDATLSQPSESNTDDEEKQTVKDVKRLKNKQKLERRNLIRDRKFATPKSVRSGMVTASGGGMMVNESVGGTSFSMASSMAEGMTPYNPPHTPPDRELESVPPCAFGTTGDGNGERTRLLAGSAHRRSSDDVIRRTPSVSVGSGGASNDHHTYVPVPLSSTSPAELAATADPNVHEERMTTEDVRGAVVELCPQGTHFAKHVSDDHTSGSEQGEDETPAGEGEDVANRSLHT